MHSTIVVAAPPRVVACLGRCKRRKQPLSHSARKVENTDCPHNSKADQTHCHRRSPKQSSTDQRMSPPSPTLRRHHQRQVPAGEASSSVTLHWDGSTSSRASCSAGCWGVGKSNSTANWMLCESFFYAVCLWVCGEILSLLGGGRGGKGQNSKIVFLFFVYWVES